MLRDIARHGSLDAREWLVFRVEDDLADGLLDQVTPGQAQGGGFGQILLQGEVFLCRSLIGPDVQVAQQLDACQFIYAEGGAAAGLLG